MRPAKDGLSYALGPVARLSAQWGSKMFSADYPFNSQLSVSFN